MQSMESIGPILRQLPPELQQEVIEYARQLVYREKPAAENH
mgnify:CR=1 FL=1